MIVNIDEVRSRARCRLPGWLFDYVDGGAGSERTLHGNVAGFGKYAFLPRVLRGVAEPDLSVNILGASWSLPIMPGPVGFCGLLHAGGELLAMRAAMACGVPMAISTYAIASMEDVAHMADPARVMMQLYVLRDRTILCDLLARSDRCGIRTIILTVDTTVTPARERDVRNGFRSGRAARLSVSQMAQIVCRPRWLMGVMRNGAPVMGNVSCYGMGNTLFEQSVRMGRQMDATLDWNDLAWLRDNWKGKLVVKGILHPADALRCATMGIDAIVVSNHGGRQMDGALSTIEALPPIADAVRNRMNILVDSGFRDGTDVVKALALGAHGVMLGRPYAYGLAAGGEQGVKDVLDYFAQGIRSSLSLLGVPSVRELYPRRGDYLHS